MAAIFEKPAGKKAEKHKLLDEIFREVEVCKECRLYKFTKNGVPGEGNPNAKIFFIGEAPGNREDITGRPFVGIPVTIMPVFHPASALYNPKYKKALKKDFKKIKRELAQRKIEG